MSNHVKKDKVMKQHTSRFVELVENAKSQINEITPDALHTWIESKKPFYLIDVRETEELAEGVIPGAIHLSKGVIERDIEKQIPICNAPIVVYCSGGFRCALVAQSLQMMGYTNVASLETGTRGWMEAGYRLAKR